MQTHKICIGLIIVMLSGLLWGCGSSVRVGQDYDVSRDFSSLKTYAWLNESQPETGDIRTDNSLLNARFRSAISDSLSNKGYQNLAQGKADFYVAYTYQIESKIESNNVSVGMGFGRSSRGRHAGVGMNTGTTVREYDEGLLVIDLVDSSKADLLWRGTGTARVISNARPENTVKAINDGVEKILSQFPPQVD